MTLEEEEMVDLEQMYKKSALEEFLLELVAVGYYGFLHDPMWSPDDCKISLDDYKISLSRHLDTFDWKKCHSRERITRKGSK